MCPYVECNSQEKLCTGTIVHLGLFRSIKTQNPVIHVHTVMQTHSPTLQMVS